MAQGFDSYSAEIVSEVQKSPYLGDGIVMDYAATQFTSYPAVVVTPQGLSGEFADNGRVRDSYKFFVLVLANRLGIEEQVETALRQLVNDIIERLQNNQVINNNVNTFLKPISVSWGYAQAPDPNMRMASMTVEIIVGQ